MRLFLSSVLLTTALIIATPASAKRGYDTTLTAPVSSAVKIEIVLSEDMVHRANNLPKKLSDRRGVRSLRSGFAGNGFYGDRDLERLTQRLNSKLKKKFARKGIEVSDTAPTVLRITIEDAKPNRPTFNQLSKQPGLSFQSIANGGAELQAELITAGGESLGTMSYEFYETDICDAQFGGIWGDAHRAFGRFASRAAKTLAPQ